MSLVEAHKNARRARILEAARVLLERHGYAGVTMRVLAEASDVSVPTLYNLFGGREPLLLAAVEDKFVTMLVPRATAHSQQDVSGLIALFEAMNASLLDSPRYARTMIQVFMASSSSRVTSMRMAQALGERVATSLLSLKERGVLRDWVDPLALAHRLCSHYLASVIGWVATRQSADTLRAITEYDLSLALAPLVAREAERERLCTRIELLQKGVSAAVRNEPKPKPKAQRPRSAARTRKLKA